MVYVFFDPCVLPSLTVHRGGLPVFENPKGPWASGVVSQCLYLFVIVSVKRDLTHAFSSFHSIRYT